MGRKKKSEAIATPMDEKKPTKTKRNVKEKDDSSSSSSEFKPNTSNLNPSDTKSDINQRPRRQIKHKYIKTNRNPTQKLSQIEDDVIKSTIEQSTTSAEQQPTSSKTTKSAKKLNDPTKSTPKSYKVKKHAAKKSIAETENDAGEQHNLVEIIEEDPNDMQEVVEIVETSGSFEYMLVEDNTSQEQQPIKTHIESLSIQNNDSTHEFLVAIEEGSSVSQNSDNSDGGIIIEVTEKLDNPEMIELDTSYDTNTQDNSVVHFKLVKGDVKEPEINETKVSENVRHSFKGALAKLQRPQQDEMSEISEIPKEKEIIQIKSSTLTNEIFSLDSSQSSDNKNQMENVETKSIDQLESKLDRIHHMPTRRMTRLLSMAINPNEDSTGMSSASKKIEVPKEKKRISLPAMFPSSSTSSSSSSSPAHTPTKLRKSVSNVETEKKLLSLQSSSEESQETIPIILPPKKKAIRAYASVQKTLPLSLDKRRQTIDAASIKKKTDFKMSKPLSSNVVDSSETDDEIIQSIQTTPTKMSRRQSFCFAAQKLGNKALLESNQATADLSKSQTDSIRKIKIKDQPPSPVKESPSHIPPLKGSPTHELPVKDKKILQSPSKIISDTATIDNDRVEKSPKPLLIAKKVLQLKNESIHTDSSDEFCEGFESSPKTSLTDFSSQEETESATTILNTPFLEPDKLKGIPEKISTKPTKKVLPGEATKETVKAESKTIKKTAKELGTKKEKEKKTKKNEKNKNDNNSDNEKSKTKKTKDSKKSNENALSSNKNVDNDASTIQLALESLKKLEQNKKYCKKKSSVPAEIPSSPPLPVVAPELPRVKTAAERKEMKPLPHEKPKKKIVEQENELQVIAKDDSKKPTKSKKLKGQENDVKTKINDSGNSPIEEKSKTLASKKLAKTESASSKQAPSSYSILSECYLPKMVKYDESLYSIEALKAAQEAAAKDADVRDKPVIPVKTYASRPNPVPQTSPSTSAAPPKEDKTFEANLAEMDNMIAEYTNNNQSEESSQSENKREPTAENEATATDKPPKKSSSQAKESKSKSETSPNEEETSIRRSGRIKNKTESNVRAQGQGLVKDKDRYSYPEYSYVPQGVPQDNSYAISEDSNTTAPLGEEYMQYFEPRVKGAEEIEKEKIDIEEGLGLFAQVVENEFKCERMISKEARKMTCDCFLTKSEIERGELGCGEDCLNRLLMIECSNRCVVGDRCTNKRFQKRKNADCTIFKTKKKGFGLKALAMIPAGEFIMEYVGEVLNSQQFDGRAEEYCKTNNKHFYFMALRSDCVIDATNRGNISRFINHSCDPNAETQKWTVNGELRIGFFSTRNIYPDEEITFDYQYQRYGKEAQKCYCEAEFCRGWIGEEPDSDEELEEEEEEEEDVEEEPEETEQEVPASVTEKDDTSVECPKLQPPINETDVSKEKSDLSESIESHVSSEETDDQKKDLEVAESPIKIIKRVKKDKSSNEKPFKRLKNKRPDICDDLDLDKEIAFLTKTNLKNQAHTLQFSRLMVRAKQQHAKRQLLYLLRNGELACRRLFLDYHGLKLLYTWMCDKVSTDMTVEWEFRIEIMETLEVLPIPNKTMLQDSKVIGMIKKWSTVTSTKGNVKSPDESPSDSGSGTPSMEDSTSPKIEEIHKEEEKTPVAVQNDEKIEPNDENSNHEEPKTVESAKPNDLYFGIDDPELMNRVKTLALKLLASWDALTEVFRIPKKLRIEQMKEHEREADLSYEAMGGAQADERQNKQTRSKMRDWSKDKYWTKDRSKPKDPNEYYEATLNKLQRRQMFEAKVAQEIQRQQQQTDEAMEHTAKCSFFRLDPRTTSKNMLPWCVDPTAGQWYSSMMTVVATPPSHAHIKPAQKKLSTNPDDYDLPQLDLPDGWKFAIDEKGRIYYYHFKIRIPQWEPPIKLEPLMESEMKDLICPGALIADPIEKNQPKEINIRKGNAQENIGIDNDDGDDDDDDSDDNDESMDSSDSEDDLLSRVQLLKKSIIESKTNLDSNLAEEISALAHTTNDGFSEPNWSDSNPVPLNSTFNFEFQIDSVLQPKKKKRRVGLVEERIISPRTDEERTQLKIDLKRYKENKEKARRRREEIKRRKALSVLGPLAKKVSKITEGLPILTTVQQEDDLDSDDEDPTSFGIAETDDALLEPDIEHDRLENFKPVNKIVDELDVLKKIRPSKRVRSDKEVKIVQKSMKRKKVDLSSETARRIKDKFRSDIAGVIVHHLSPYRKETCKIGRITTNEDFKHLAKKLTHFVMLKELKHCDNTVNVLEVTDSVKQKSKEFIRKYMAKFGEIYSKPENEPEYKDFNSGSMTVDF